VAVEISLREASSRSAICSASRRTSDAGRGSLAI